MILLQLRYHSVNVNLQCIAQEGDHSPKYLQILSNYDISPTTTFGKFHKRTVSLNGQTALIFFSDKIFDLMPQMNDIQFDGTFYCVPRQFYQLWTIFVSVGRYSLPTIHCLMIGKEQGLYICILKSIRDLIPQFKPTTSMSDWEIAPRNAFKDIYPEVHITGCWFHFPQRIWHATQKLGLVQSFNTKEDLSTFVGHLMAIPSSQAP